MSETTAPDFPYSPIILALDMVNVDDAVKIALAVREHVGMFKVGLEFFLANGCEGYRAVETVGHSIMLDLKLHDIPTTMTKAVKALLPLNPYAITVHASAGMNAIAAVREATESYAFSHPLIWAVTALTSFSEKTIWQTGFVGSIGGYVRRMADNAAEAGAHGIVCSPLELESLRKSHRGMPLIAAGIRPCGASIDDQRRTMGARKAMQKGATWLVVGRPVTTAPDPVAAARDLREEALNV